MNIVKVNKEGVIILFLVPKDRSKWKQDDFERIGNLVSSFQSGDSLQVFNEEDFKRSCDGTVYKQYSDLILKEYEKHNVQSEIS